MTPRNISGPPGKKLVNENKCRGKQRRIGGVGDKVEEEAVKKERPIEKARKVRRLWKLRQEKSEGGITIH